MRLLLIRHGQTPANVQGQLDTKAPGLPLTELGLRQASAIPSALKGRRIDGIAASDRIRTQMTGQPLAEDRGLEIEVLPGLGEIDAGGFEMASGQDAITSYIDTVVAWVRGETTRRVAGGEDGVHFLDRYDKAIATIENHGWETGVAFSHGAAIRTWVASRVPGSWEQHPISESLRNTAMVELEGSTQTGWSCLSWGTEPLGGAGLVDLKASDPTGSLEE